MFEVLVGWILTAVISLCVTPLIKKVAFKIGAVDIPNKRRVNTKIMPTIGGLGIFITTFIALFFIQPIENSTIIPIFLGASAVIITGLIDDIKEISPLMKIIGLTIAALIIYFSGMRIEMITIPFIGQLSMGVLSLPVTLIWILAITNAINLIDGLDGLATGVSIIALVTMGIIGYFFLNIENVVITIIIFTIVSAAIGFLPYNFFPASIFLGDTGALFLGFMIAIMSLQGLKNVTFVTLIIPIVILGIPITDTIYAMLRRKLNNMPISSADKHHMHHRLMSLGLTHRQTVLAIYCIALIFSIISLLYPLSSVLGSVLLTVSLLFGIELFVELIGLVGANHQPMINQIKRISKKINRKNKNR
ncbi:glycosyltransferase family 4 protein [Marinilactibacillus psychrotolerans]|uniref:glycosyltransferase family 4 protein n=1 Tax=Marinilactibacillus psychrotolerans TaxID=191770 RepID=UPI003885AC08